MRPRLILLALVAVPAIGSACPAAFPARHADELTRHFTTRAFSVSVPAGWAREEATGTPFRMWRFRGGGLREMDVLFGHGEATLEATVQHGLGNLRRQLSRPVVSRIAIRAAAGGRRRAQFTVHGVDRRTGRPVAEAIVTYQSRDATFFTTLLRVPGADPPSRRLEALLRDLVLRT